MKATIYKELSNKQTPIELQAGLTVQEALPDLDLDNAIIVINGRIENCNYVLQEKDKATIRLTPSGTTALIVTAIVLSVVAVGAGIAGGIYAYNAKLQAEKAQAELEKMKKLSNRPEVDNRPFLRGASNTIATGANQPYIIGRHFFTPYLLSQPFYEIAGADGIDQYTYTVLECGFNKQVLKKIAIDDVTIKTFTDTAPQEGGYDLDTGIFAEGGKIEIAQDGGLLTEIPALNYKVESKTCNDEIPRDSEVSEGKKEYLTYTLNPYAMSVDIAITFPYGLFAVDDKGDKIETQVSITPQYSLDGGASWNDFTFNNNGVQTNLFKRNISTQELRYVAHKDFSADDYVTLKAKGQTAIYIRVRSNGNKDSVIKNDCYCLFYQSKCFDPDKSSNTELVPCKIIEDRERAFCTILGLKLKASKINEEKLKKINVITQGIARTWNGTKWSEEKSKTRNPAAWALEIETSDSHPASKYKDSELDLESFGEFYEYCEKQGYKFDWVITQSVKKDDTLNHIMEATGACIYRDIYGRRAIAIDKPQENALAVYNPQNIISIQNKKTFSRRTDGLRIKYVNSKDDLYQEDTYLLMREVNGEPLEITPDSIIKDINVTGITTFEHIVKYARRLMAIEALRPKTTIIEVGNEGVFYTPYSKILIQDDSLKIGIGKGYTIAGVEWDGLLLKKIYTNEPLTLEATETYGIIVNCFTERGVYPLPIKVAGDGETNELIVLTEIKAGSYARPDKGNVFSLGEIGMDGEFTKVSTPYIISQIKRSDKGFNLELVNYHEAIYESGTIPDYKSNITQRRSTIKKSIPPNLNAKDGKDGLTYYTWIKFAKDSNGTDMSDYPDDTRRFMGISENNLIREESSDPADYKWIDMRGKDGIAGAPGKDGKPKFTWVKYADNAEGGGMSDSPDGKDYIGFAFNKDTQTESSNPADYHWQRVKGEQGVQGVPGKEGTSKFLPSLEVQGDYENQIGTYQGQFYRWTNSKWELLNAVMPPNPICYYDFDSLPEIPDNLNDTYNKHFHNWKQGINIGYEDNYYLYCVEPSGDESRRKITITYDGNFIVETLAGGGFYIFPYHNPNRIAGKLIIMRFRVIKGTWIIGIENKDVAYYSINKYTTVHKIMPDTGAFIVFAAAGAIIEISDIYIGDGSVKATAIPDLSGNDNHLFLKGNKRIFKTKENNDNGAFLYRGCFLETKKTFKTKQYTISFKIKPRSIKGEYHHILNFNNFRPFIHNNILYSSPEEHQVLNLEDKIYNVIYSIDDQRIKIFIDNILKLDYLCPATFTAASFIIGTWHSSHGFYNGMIGQILVFDRILTDQEMLYLDRNPQYPIKNYTSADWAVCPQNPDNALANATPKYLGVVESVPVNSAVTITKGERMGGWIANPGDWVLSGKTVDDWKVGICYKWNGITWIALEPAQNYVEEYQACLLHMFEIEELKKKTEHYGALFANMLIAQEAFITKLSGDIAFLKALVVKKLHIDTIEGDEHNDFEAWFDETNGLKINNRGEEIFRVDTSGNAFLKNAFMQNCTFNGDIYSGPLELSPQTPTAQQINVTTTQTAKDIFNKYGGCSYPIKSKNGYDDLIYFLCSSQIFTEDYTVASFGVVGYRKCKVYVIQITSSNNPPNNADMALFGETIEKRITRPFFWGDIPNRDFSESNKNLNKNHDLEVLSGGKTFRLLDLPTEAPALKGSVWTNGKDGILRIKN